MRLATIGLALLAAAGCEKETAPKAAPPSTARGLAWETDEAAAFARARAEHKGVLVHFAAAWCTPCAELEVSLAEPAVAERVRRSFVALRIDATESDDRVMQIRDRYGAMTLPAIVMIAPEGAVLGRIRELVPPDRLADLVDEAANGLRRR